MYICRSYVFTFKKLKIIPCKMDSLVPLHTHARLLGGTSARANNNAQCIIFIVMIRLCAPFSPYELIIISIFESAAQQQNAIKTVALTAPRAFDLIRKPNKEHDISIYYYSAFFTPAELQRRNRS